MQMTEKLAYEYATMPQTRFVKGVKTERILGAVANVPEYILDADRRHRGSSPAAPLRPLACAALILSRPVHMQTDPHFEQGSGAYAIIFAKLICVEANNRIVVVHNI